MSKESRGVVTHDLALPPPRFSGTDGFRRALRQRVNGYFTDTGRRQRDCPSMYLKTTTVLGCLGVSYTLLVFAPVGWWLAIPLTVVLGLSLAAVGFNIQHDGGHGAYSERRWINKLAAMTLDLLGASSYIWARKHNSIHHSYTNITGHDDDINVGLLGRLSPHQQHLWFHRFQHLYLWFLYGLLPVKWHVYDDFRDVLTGRVGGHRLPRPKGRDLVIFIVGKIAFFTLAFALPLLLHPWWIVLAVYAAAAFVQGVVLSVVFQLAHCVEEADFPLPSTGTGRMATTWAEHQVQTTVDFAAHDRLLTWFVGGLNFQIEHHLFPQICHVHYPALAPLVQQTCREFGLKYTAQPTLLAGLTSHFRWLRRMGGQAAGRGRTAAEQTFSSTGITPSSPMQRSLRSKLFSQTQSQKA
jgi:linoleoyl-CoA desaturase